MAGYDEIIKKLASGEIGKPSASQQIAEAANGGMSYGAARAYGYTRDQIHNQALKGGAYGAIDTRTPEQRAAAGEAYHQERMAKQEAADAKVRGSFWDILGNGLAMQNSQYLPADQQLSLAQRQAKAANDFTTGLKESKEASKAIEWNGRQQMVDEYKHLSYEANRARTFHDPKAAELAQQAADLQKEIQRRDIMAGNGERDLNGADRITSVVGSSAKGIGSGLVELGADVGQAIGKASVNQQLLSGSQFMVDQMLGEDTMARYNQVTEAMNSEEGQRVWNQMYSVADSLGEGAARDLNRAKNGLGALGRAGVDIGQNIIQMGFDAGVGALTGGSSLVPMFARVAGESMREARLEGASLERRLAYGVTKATIEVATEKMFDGVAKLYGKGAMDDIVEVAIRRAASTDAGKSMLRILAGASGEAIEEVVSGLLDPLAEAVKTGKIGKLDAEEMAYSAFIGFTIGFLGSGTTMINGENAKLNAQANSLTNAYAQLGENPTFRQELSDRALMKPDAYIGAHDPNAERLRTIQNALLNPVSSRAARGAQAGNTNATTTAVEEDSRANLSPEERYVDNIVSDENMSDNEKATRILSSGYYAEAFENMSGVELDGTEAENKRAIREWLQNRTGTQEDSEGADVPPDSANASTDESGELNSDSYVGRHAASSESTAEGSDSYVGRHESQDVDQTFLYGEPEDYSTTKGYLYYQMKRGWGGRGEATQVGVNSLTGSSYPDSKPRSQMSTRDVTENRIKGSADYEAAQTRKEDNEKRRAEFLENESNFYTGDRTLDSLLYSAREQLAQDWKGTISAIMEGERGWDQVGSNPKESAQLRARVLNHLDASNEYYVRGNEVVREARSSSETEEVDQYASDKELEDIDRQVQEKQQSDQARYEQERYGAPSEDGTGMQFSQREKVELARYRAERKRAAQAEHTGAAKLDTSKLIRNRFLGTPDTSKASLKFVRDILTDINSLADFVKGEGVYKGFPAAQRLDVLRAVFPNANWEFDGATNTISLSREPKVRGAEANRFENGFVPADDTLPSSNQNDIFEYIQEAGLKVPTGGTILTRPRGFDDDQVANRRREEEVQRAGKEAANAGRKSESGSVAQVLAEAAQQGTAKDPDGLLGQRGLVKLSNLGRRNALNAIEHYRKQGASIVERENFTEEEKRIEREAAKYGAYVTFMDASKAPSLRKIGAVTVRGSDPSLIFFRNSGCRIGMQTILRHEITHLRIRQKFRAGHGATLLAETFANSSVGIDVIRSAHKLYSERYGDPYTSKITKGKYKTYAELEADTSEAASTLRVVVDNIVYEEAYCDLCAGNAELFASDPELADAFPELVAHAYAAAQKNDLFSNSDIKSLTNTEFDQTIISGDNKSGSMSASDIIDRIESEAQRKSIMRDYMYKRNMLNSRMKILNTDKAEISSLKKTAARSRRIAEIESQMDSLEEQLTELDGIRDKALSGDSSSIAFLRDRGIKFDAKSGTTPATALANAATNDAGGKSASKNSRVTKKDARDMARTKYEEDLFKQQELRSKTRGVDVNTDSESAKQHPRSKAEYLKKVERLGNELDRVSEDIRKAVDANDYAKANSLDEQYRELEKQRNSYRLKIESLDRARRIPNMSRNALEKKLADIERRLWEVDLESEEFSYKHDYSSPELEFEEASLNRAYDDYKDALELNERYDSSLHGEKEKTGTQPEAQPKSENPLVNAATPSTAVSKMTTEEINKRIEELEQRDWELNLLEEEFAYKHDYESEDYLRQHERLNKEYDLLQNELDTRAKKRSAKPKPEKRAAKATEKTAPAAELDAPQSSAEYAAQQRAKGEDGRSNVDMAKQERATAEEEYRQQRYADTRGVDSSAGWSQQERARREEQREAEETVEAAENHFAATQAYGEEVHRNIIKTANRVANMVFLPDPSGKPVRNRNARHMQPLIDAVVGLADGSLTLNDFINTYHEFGEAENKDTVGYFYDPAVDARLRRLKEFPMDGEGQYSTEARSILKETMDMLEHRTQRLLNKRADASKAVTEIKSTNTGLDGSTPALFKGFMLKQLRPDTFFHAITGFAKNTSNIAYQLAGKAEKSTQRKINVSTSAQNYFRGAMENMKAYRDFSTGKTKISTKIPGLDRSMSMNEALGLLRTLETDGAKDHIIKCAEREVDDDGYGTVFSHSEKDLYGGNQENGFRNPLRASLLSDEAIKALQGAWDVDPNQRGRAISQARAKARLELDALAKSLRAEVEADAVASKFDQAITRAMRMLGKEIDTTYSAMYGVKAAKQGKNYWPLSIASTGNNAELMSDIRSGLKNAKFIQERVGPSGSLRIMTATDVMSRYIDAASNFAAFAELSDDLELMSKTYRGDTSFKAQLEKSFGREAGQWLDRYVDTLNGKRGNASRLATLIRSNLAQSSLLLNGGVALKQSPSYFDMVGAGIDFDIAMQAWRPLRSAKSWSNNPLVNVIATRSSMLESRKQGYSDVEIGEMTKDARNLSKRLVDRIPTALTNWITKTDFRTVSNVLLACQMQVEKNGGVEVGSAEYYDRIARLFEDVVLKTQPIYSAQFRAEYQRSDNELIRSLSMFRSQQTQNLNQIINAVGEYSQIKKGGSPESIRKAEQNMHRVFAGQITGSVLFGILSGVARGLIRKDDDFKDKDGNVTAGAVLSRLGLNTAESIAGTIWFGDVAAKALVDVVSNAVTGGKGTKEFYSVNDNVISGFNSFITNLISFASKPSAKKGWNIAFSLSQLTGLPIRNCYNMVNAVAKDFQSVDERFNFTVDDSSENAPAEPDKNAASTALANAATATKPSSTSSEKKEDTDLDKQIRIAKKEASEYDTSRDNATMDKILAAKLDEDDTDSYVDKYMSKPYREVYFTLRDAGFEPKEIYNRYKDIDTENGGNGNISQKEMLAYYRAHPESSALIAAIYNSKGYTKYPTWDEYIKHKK